MTYHNCVIDKAIESSKSHFERRWWVDVAIQELHLLVMSPRYCCISSLHVLLLCRIVWTSEYVEWPQVCTCAFSRTLLVWDQDCNMFSLILIEAVCPVKWRYYLLEYFKWYIGVHIIIDHCYGIPETFRGGIKILVPL